MFRYVPNQLRTVLIIGVVALGFTNSPLPGQAADPAVVATWQGGIHFLPASATRSGQAENINFRDETLKQWMERLKGEVLKPGAKVPAVIYIHGCKGPVAAGTWAVPFNNFGFAFFAPDSFKRPGRVALCYQGDGYSKFRMRQEEIRFARQQISKLDWVEQNRIVLVGKSEGGGAVADLNDDGYIAHVILANDCKYNNGNPQAPDGTAVLNLVGGKDLREGLCSISREVGGSKAMLVPGQGHSFDGVPEAVAAVAKFLTACCGYVPSSTTVNLDPETTAKKLFEEFGGMATLDARMKADEALEKGDGKGHKFWMRVHDIAVKLIGG